MAEANRNGAEKEHIDSIESPMNYAPKCAEGQRFTAKLWR